MNTWHNNLSNSFAYCYFIIRNCPRCAFRRNKIDGTDLGHGPADKESCFSPQLIRSVLRSVQEKSDASLFAQRDHVDSLS